MMIENAPLQARDIIALYDQSFPYFQKVWEKGAENERYRRVENFDPTEKAQIESQGRQAYSVPMASNKLDQHISFQRKNRTEFRLEAVNDKNDEIKAQVGNVQFRDMENRSDMIHLESDLYDSGMGVAFGASEIVIDYDDDLNKVVTVKKVDYRDCMWDSNSVEYEKDKDAMWVCKMTKVARFQIREEFGDKVADRISQDNSIYGRENETFYLTKNKDRDLDILTLFTHEQKVLRTYYWVLFNDYANLHGKKDTLVALKTKNKKEANDYLKELEVPYLLRGIELSKENGVETKRVKEIDRYVLTLDGILQYEATDRPHFFLDFYFSYFFAGKFWTLMDVLKSTQQFFDRYLAQIDYALGTDIKQAYEINVNLLADGMTIEDALDALHQDGYIPVKASGAIKSLRGAGINPQWVNMLQVMKSFLEDLAGGRSFQGLSEGSDESGKAIKLKQEKGEGLSSIFLDNLNRWKQSVGNKAIWAFNKHDTAQRIIKVGGSQIDENILQQLQQQGLYEPSQKKGSGYLRINTPMTHLRDAKFELKVVETQLSESAREKKLSALMALGEVNPNMQALPSYNIKFLEAIGLDYGDRTEIIEDYKSMIKGQAEAAQKQQQAEEQAQQIEDSVKVAEVKLKKEELEIKREELKIKKNDNSDKKSKSGSKR